MNTIKALFTLIITLSMPLVCCAQSEIKHGFKDVMLDSNRSSISGLTYLNSFDGYEVYERKNQDLNIGDIKLKAVKYFFYQDQLTEIRVYYDSFDFDNIVDLFSSTYGDSSGLSGIMYSWGNSKTSINVSKGTGVRYMNGKPLYPYFSITSRGLYIKKANAKTNNRAEDL